MDTTSIANKPSIDVNQITADGFDFNAYIAETERNRLSLLRQNGLQDAADEIETKYKMAAFIEEITSNRVDPEANRLALQAATNQDTAAGAWENIKRSWRNGRNQMDRAELSWEMVLGNRPIEYLPPINQLPVESDTWFESSLNAASNMLPMIWDTTVSGAKYAAAFGLPAALIALKAGQAGPQAALLEEAVTVPGAFLIFGGIGAMYGSVKKAAELEGGLMFDELLHMRGPNGEKIDLETARAIATGVGLVNGLLEVAQIDELIKTIPGGKRLLRKGIAQSIKKVIQNRSLLKLAGKHLVSYGKTVAVETVQELAQESSNIVGGELAKYLTNRANEGKISHASVDEIMQRYQDTAIQSIQGFSVLAAPGHIGGTVIDVVNEQGVKVNDKVAPDVEIKRVTDIKARIDPKVLVEQPLIEVEKAPVVPSEGLKVTTPAAVAQKAGDKYRGKAYRNETGLLVKGKTAADVVRFEQEELGNDLGVAPEKLAELKNIPSDRVVWVARHKEAAEQYVSEGETPDVQDYTEIVKGGEIIAEIPDGVLVLQPPAAVSPEAVIPQAEKIEIEKAEQQIKAKLPETVNPKLYIGNVTARMKKTFAEIWEAEEADVKPFLDGPFPAKRTAIEMTGDEAMGTLVMLEASLDQRLNDNLIRTENDLAQANADWGDIKELRKVLDLPEVKRPFTVKRAPKPIIVTPDSISQRISFVVQMSKADKVTTTRIEQLNTVMRRMREAAQIGYEEAGKHYRQLQYLRKQEQLRQHIIKQIKAEPSKNIDPFYAKTIQQIQEAIDFKADPKAKESLRKYLEADPERANEIPQDILDALEKRDVQLLSLAQLQQISNEVKRLSKLGRLKSKLLRKQQRAALEKNIKTAISTVKKAKPGRALAIQTKALRPIRLLDMLDGGRNFEGPMVTMFDTAIQDAANSELTHIDHRQQRGIAKMKELGLSLFHFVRRRKVGDITLTVDDMLGIYAGWMNEQSRLALQYGGIKMESGKALPVTEELYNEVVTHLTEEEKKWGEFIIEEYADHWERIRNALIETENRDLGRVTNYTKIRRLGVDKSSHDILAGFDYSQESDFRKEIPRVHNRFTIERIQVPPEYQMPIDTSLTRIWLGEVRKQEHYIAMAKLLKDLNSVVEDKRFADVIKNKFGEPMHTALKDYLKRVADPDYYRSFDDIENLSRALRKNTAIAYLAYNLLTMAKQAPSLAFYAINSSFSDLLMSAIQVAANPRQTYEAILSHNRQIGHAAIVREMEELKHTNKKAHSFIVRRVGNAGLRGIYEIDRAVRVIGENAVINYQMRKGLSLEEAAKKARQTSLRTQPAAAAKDIAALYANDERLNWFTMFTNQLNQIYNVATYDIPAAWHNKQFAEVGRSVIALSVVAAWIWALQHKELPDEKEEILDALAEQSLAALPLIGSAALAGKRGWGVPTPAPIAQAAKTAKAIHSLDMDKLLPVLFEDIAIGTGVPYIGIKRIYKTAEEQDLWELVGGK